MRLGTPGGFWAPPWSGSSRTPREVCRIASRNSVTSCLTDKVTGSEVRRFRSGVSRHVADRANQPLDGLLAPHPDALLQRMELSRAVVSWVAGLELDEKFQGGLIRPLFKAPSHLLPVLLEDVGTSTTRPVAEPTIRPGPDHDATRASGLAPTTNPPDESLVLPAGEPAWKLETQLFEELRGADVGKFLQPAACDRPHHAQRLDTGLSRLGVDQRRLLLHSCRRRDRRWWGHRLERWGRTRRLFRKIL